ncbi:hypothetical protein [Halomicrobium sp. LC1Hm]|uniref:hypothetical protein n=1 Tax=Halomicrobium sp. LC1Hm TaxID=2610902 RepID=UPI0012982982|nr:hypothetical protein [Halomicrobium sp. LC1Hm]QGA83691.1 putative transcriptional regulator [Halomicrobium sp. LC1Hm]
MSALPTWIEDRIDKDLDKTLTQQHVVETMVESERPFFSTKQLQARVKPDVCKATVRNRLDELRELDVVATESYPESVTLYYIDYPETSWPLSPAGKHALATETPLDRLSTRGFLTLTETAGIRTLVLAGLQLSLALFVFGGILTILGTDISTTGSDIAFWDTAFDLLLFCLLLLVAERTAQWIRRRRTYGIDADD